MSLLLEAFESLPVRRPSDDPDLFRAGAEEALLEFHTTVTERYTEGTLGRILSTHLDPRQRKAAAVALGLVGTMASNSVVAQALHDHDLLVRQAASDAIWDIWFRGEGGRQASGLRQAMAVKDQAERIAEYDDLIQQYPEFAEAYNQRAIQLFNVGHFAKAVSDCQEALRLNPYHFGAAAGLGQCFLRMNKPGAAVRAFAHALELNPDLDNLRMVMETLRDAMDWE